VAGTDASAPSWDLGRLIAGGAEEARRLAADAVSLSEAFAAAHQGRVGTYDAGGLRSVLDEYQRILEAITRASTYATLRFDADTEPPCNGALVSAVDELEARVQTLTNFWELEWIAIADDSASPLLAAPELEPFAHLLATLRWQRPHRLSAAEERILTEKALTAGDAWQRLFDEQLAAVEPELDGEAAALDEVLARLAAPSREERRDAMRAVSAALAPGLRTRVSIFNVLLADHATEDRLRHFPHWLAARNLENEASDPSVQALLDAVVARYDIARRWSAIKARALGLPRLADFDRLAPVGATPPRYGWSAARELVVSAYASFSAQLGTEADRFFTEGLIDGVPRTGKAPGAYCMSTVPAADPFILLTFSGRREDVLTLGHEIGHGLHFRLAAGRGILQMETPVTVAETASVFGETLTFAALLAGEHDPAARFGLLAYQLDEAVATVFRQVAIHRFEAAVHGDRRERGELSAERIAEHWLAANRELYGDAVQLTDGYETYWSQISHVFTSPGYVYAYAYGQLLALSIYARYLQEGERFVARYLELLTAGGSRSPRELAAIVGVNLDDPGFWDTGLGLLDEQLSEAERALEAMPR
jgi:oligoendopeptidase F